MKRSKARSMTWLLLGMALTTTEVRGSEGSPPNLFQIILNVPNMEESLEFYLNVLELTLLEPRTVAEAKGASFVRLSSEGALLALHASPEESSSRSRLSFAVTDLDATRRRLPGGD